MAEMKRRRADQRDRLHEIRPNHVGGFDRGVEQQQHHDDQGARADRGDPDDETAEGTEGLREGADAHDVFVVGEGRMRAEHRVRLVEHEQRAVPGRDGS